MVWSKSIFRSGPPIPVYESTVWWSSFIIVSKQYFNSIRGCSTAQVTSSVKIPTKKAHFRNIGFVNWYLDFPTYLLTSKVDNNIRNLLFWQRESAVSRERAFLLVFLVFLCSVIDFHIYSGKRRKRRKGNNSPTRRNEGQTILQQKEEREGKKKWTRKSDLLDSTLKFQEEQSLGTYRVLDCWLLVSWILWHHGWDLQHPLRRQWVFWMKLNIRYFKMPFFPPDVFTGDMNAFRAKIVELWFDGYDRDGTSADVVGSSGFEHVFMGELKQGDVSGFHNWFHFHFEEEATNINYLGNLSTADFAGVRKISLSYIKRTL